MQQKWTQQKKKYYICATYERTKINAKRNNSFFFWQIQRANTKQNINKVVCAVWMPIYSDLFFVSVYISFLLRFCLRVHLEGFFFFSFFFLLLNQWLLVLAVAVFMVVIAVVIKPLRMDWFKMHWPTWLCVYCIAVTIACADLLLYYYEYVYERGAISRTQVCIGRADITLIIFFCPLRWDFFFLFEWILSRIRIWETR